MSGSHEFEGALSDALKRRAASVEVAPAEGRARFDEHLAADARHRHRRHVTTSVFGVVAVVAVGAAAIAFAAGRDSHSTPQTVAAASPSLTGAAADSLKIRGSSAPSGLPKLLPAMPGGWALESAGDYAPDSSSPPPPAATMLLYRSADGAHAIRVDIGTDPNSSGFDPAASTGDPNASVVQVHGQPAQLTIDPKGVGVDVLMWAESANTMITLTSNGVQQQQLLAFAESLQPAAEGWSAFPMPTGFSLVYSGDPNAPMGYGGPSWQLGYRGPEDLSQPQDPSIAVSASQGTADALTVFPSPSDRPVSVEVGGNAGVMISSSDSPPYRTLVWFDPKTGLVLTVNASGISAEELLSFASSFHSVGDDEWQRTVAPVLPKPDEPSGPVEPPVPTQPIAIPNLASGTLPSGRTWTINGTQYRDAPDENLVCGDLTFAGSDSTVAGACASADGSPRPGMSIGTDGTTLLFGATPSVVTNVTIEQSGADPVTVATVASSDASYPMRWYVVEVADAKRVTAITGTDASGQEVMRVSQPLGPPYPDYDALDRAPKREVASGTVDGAPWTLVAADAPLSDGSGPVACVTLTFASETAMTCPVVAVGGVNGNGIIDATVAVLRKRMFLLAHLDAGVAKVVVVLDDGSNVGANVVSTGSGSGSTAVVVHIPDGRTATTLHAWDTSGKDMGPVDISALGTAPHPTPFAVDDATRSAAS